MGESENKERKDGFPPSLAKKLIRSAQASVEIAEATMRKHIADDGSVVDEAAARDAALKWVLARGFATLAQERWGGLADADAPEPPAWAVRAYDLTLPLT